MAILVLCKRVEGLPAASCHAHSCRYITFVTTLRQPAVRRLEYLPSVMVNMICPERACISSTCETNPTWPNPTLQLDPLPPLRANTQRRNPPSSNMSTLGTASIGIRLMLGALSPTGSLALDKSPTADTIDLPVRGCLPPP
ncbi:hypothetical protein LIA77_00201 [Sarocladium implicatum]|nr:hypothetical protein LIA77_00201 [Sarocladium implicatum]